MIDIFFVGPQKSATTWLYTLVKSSPDVFVTERKELGDLARTSLEQYEYDAYLESFSGADDTQLAADFSPNYLHSPLALKRIKDLNPNAKIVIVLRNPIERMVSHIMHSIRREALSIEQLRAISTDDKHFRQSCYFDAAKGYIDEFGFSNVLFISFSDIKNNPHFVASKIFEFIGKQSFNLSIPKQVGKGYEPKYRVVERVKQFFYKRTIKNRIGQKCINLSRRSSHPRLYKTWNNKSRGERDVVLQFCECHFGDALNQDFERLRAELNRYG